MNNNLQYLLDLLIVFLSFGVRQGKLTICSIVRNCNRKVSLPAGGLRVFLSRKNPGKRGVRDRRRHLGRARKSAGENRRTPRFPGFSAIKTPSNRLQAGYREIELIVVFKFCILRYRN